MSELRPEELTEEEARKRLRKLFKGEVLGTYVEAGKVEALDKWLSVILILAFIPATLIATHTYYNMVVSHAS